MTAPISVRKILKSSPGTSQGTKLEFLEFRKKNHPEQLRFHSIVRWGWGGFPSHFTDLPRARLSTSVTSSVFKEEGTSCLIALCSTSWQLMTKWEVEIGPFFKDHCHYFTHQFSLMNRVIQPQETLPEEQFSQRKLLWKPFLTDFSWFDNFLGMRPPPSPSHKPVRECCSLSTFLSPSFHEKN